MKAPIKLCGCPHGCIHDQFSDLKKQVWQLRTALRDRIATENGNDVPTRGDEEEMREYLRKYTEPK